MKKLFMSFMAVVLSLHSLFGSPASRKPIVCTQPDGTKLTVYCRGDEYGAWVETEKNDIVVKNDKGYFEYATIVNNEIASSGIRVKTNASGVVMAAPSGLASKNRIADLMLNQREKLMVQLDSIEWKENSKMAVQAEVMRAKAKPTPLPQGNPKVLCIMMEFEDYRFTHSKKEFEDMWNKKGYRAPKETDGGSVRDYYLENSYGQMDVQATVIGPFTAKYKYKHYKHNGFMWGAFTFTSAIELATEAINAAIKQGYRLENFDSNGDKTVDAVHIIFAGPAVFPSDTDSIGLLWPHHSWALVAQGAYRTWDFMITPEIVSYAYDENRIADVGTICHEFGHILGAPDFYDTTLKDQIHGTGYPGTGDWDIMCSGGGDCPPHHNPFTKTFIYGWISPIEVAKKMILPTDQNKVYTLKPIDSNKDVYIMPTGTSEEYFMFENKAKTGFNKSVDNGGGNLLIYHIHKSIFDEISAFGKIATINATHPQKCYVVNASATKNPDKTVESYNGGLPDGKYEDYKWSYPQKDNIFFTARSMPSAISWKGEATGANICFIHRDGNNIKFVVNPQIDGKDVINNGSATYYVNNCALAIGEKANYKDSKIQIKWSYTYIPNTALEARQTASPIVISDDSRWPFTIKRGQYPVYDNVAALRGDDYAVRARALDFDPKIVGGGIINRPINVTYKYFTGTIILKATITDGKNTYVLTKNIKLEDPAPNKAPALARATSEESEEEQEHQPQDTYRLVYANPVIANSANICVEKFEDGVFVPYEGTYTLTIVGDRTGMIQYPAQTQPYCAIECGNLPTGVYQLILQVDGQVVATSKMLKLY